MTLHETSLFAELKYRRKYLIEIGVVAVYIALCINIASNYLFEFTKEHPISASILLPLLVTAPVYVIFKYIYGKSITESELSLLLPISINGNKLTVLNIHGYSVPSRANTMLLTNPVLAESFLKDSRNFFNKDELLKEGPLRNTISDMVTALVVSLIKLYSEHSLTTASLYHKEYRHHAWKFKSFKMSTENLKATAQKNNFLGMESIRLPEGITLSIRQKQDRGSRCIQLDSAFSWIKINILPYWTIVTETNGRKTYKIVIRNVNTQKLDVLMIPLKITTGIKFRQIFSNQIESYYSWTYGLKEDAIKWLSWEEYEKNDLERLVVDMHRELKEIKKDLTNKKKQST